MIWYFFVTVDMIVQSGKKTFGAQNLPQTKDECREVLERLGRILGIRDLSDWYAVNQKQLLQIDSKRTLSNFFDGSLPKALEWVYPHHSWVIWKFDDPLPRGFWDSSINQREFMDWLGKELRLRNMNSWYRVTKEEIFRKGGSGLFGRYRHSRYHMLSSIYPNHPWIKDYFTTQLLAKLSRSRNRDPSLWKNLKDQREFMDALGKKLGFQEIEHWYKVTKKMIGENGGYSLLAKYEYSVMALLQSVFPEHSWISHRFVQKTENSFWESKKNQVDFLDWVSQQLNYQSMEDWYGISIKTIRQMGGGGLLQKYGNSPSKMIQSVYPNYPWNIPDYKIQL
jgi:hypothetical protein